MQTTATTEVGATTPQESTEKLIFVKSHSSGTDSKGRNKLDLRFSEEETKMVIEELGKIKSRAKIQLHYSDNTAFLFIKEVQEKGASFQKKSTSGANAADVKSKVQAFKDAQKK